MVGPVRKSEYIFFILVLRCSPPQRKYSQTQRDPQLHVGCLCCFCYVDRLFRRLGDSTLSTITSSICSLERAQRPAKVIPLVLQCLSDKKPGRLCV